jgi:hypothetical protein
MFEFNYCEKSIMNNTAVDNIGDHDGIDIDDDAMMITIGVQTPHRERKISSECEDMLRDLYDDIQEITVNCSGNSGNMMTNSFSGDNYTGTGTGIDSYYDYNDENNIESLKSAMLSDYEWNCTMPILTHICGFYGLKKRGTKAEIVKSIVEFELLSENAEIVDQRKKIFEFMRIIKENEYMKRFILFP